MEDDDFMKKLEGEAQDLRSKNAQLNSAISASSFEKQDDPNTLELQVDTGEMLGRIEHFLRGEYVSVDKDGNEFWTKPKMMKDGKEVIDTSLILFNDYGVNAIMSTIGNYIDKNTFLSFYEELRINEILADLGEELAAFIFCNYEVMGMDTEFKKTRFQLTVITIIHTIESCYRRALNGLTFKELNSSRILMQSDNMGDNNNSHIKKKFNLFDRKSW